jgi:hypothetical protein
MEYESDQLQIRSEAGIDLITAGALSKATTAIANGFRYQTHLSK